MYRVWWRPNKVIGILDKASKPRRGEGLHNDTIIAYKKDQDGCFYSFSNLHVQPHDDVIVYCKYVNLSIHSSNLMYTATLELILHSETQPENKYTKF